MDQANVSESQRISTELLRKKIREYALNQRATARAAATDSLRFGLGEIKTHIEELSLTENDVKGLANRIKRRKHATKEDMYRLSHAFLLSNENINAFANTQGALQVLVKELTGSNAERQISAIECLCNLSLGEAHVCEKICNLCGSYLVTYLESSEQRLKQTSLWTLSNLIATGNKNAETLFKMELLRKLWSLYVCKENVEYCEDAGICLQLLSLKTKHLLNEDHHTFIKEKMLQKGADSIGSEYLLQIVFNCDFLHACSQQTLEEPFLVWLLDFALRSLHCSTEMNVTSNRLRIIYAIRIIANLLASHYICYRFLKKQLTEQFSSSLCALFDFLFKFSQKELVFEILWLLRNLLEAARQLNEDPKEIENFLASISIPESVERMLLM